MKTPSSIQPTTSLAIPAATVICPKSRRIRPISDRILATTASDETDNASATNRAKVVRSPDSPRNSVGNKISDGKPAPSGTSKLPAVTSAAGLPSF